MFLHWSQCVSEQLLSPSRNISGVQRVQGQSFKQEKVHQRFANYLAWAYAHTRRVKIKQANKQDSEFV